MCAGHWVLKGSMFLVAIWALHHDAAVWHDPEEFIPERFLPSDDGAKPAVHGWQPFGERCALLSKRLPAELLLTSLCLHR